MRKILKYLTSRLSLIIILLLIQIGLYITFLSGLWNCSIYIQGIFKIVGLIFVLIILNSESNPTFKISWIILILILPLGWTLYLIFHIKPKEDIYKKKIYKEKSPLLEEISQQNSDISRIFKYIKNTSNMDIFNHTDTKYYPSGEYFYLDYIQDLKSAKKYIFLEYFIISRETMWSTILDILKDKASQGVEIRLIYDDMGTISLLPRHYDDYLKSIGIKTAVFNKIKAFPNPNINYRDHRKITIIDGTIAYTGGLNLSDEYINLKERFGYWKDTALKIRGDAVKSMILMYFEIWKCCSNEDVSLDNYFVKSDIKSCGYVQPFSDNPLDNSPVFENTYMGIINSAKRYVYICTPYLILDNEMVSSLCLASRSGVDVKIITPHIPDKKYVYYVTYSNYRQLLKSGVKIFEFEEGFIHSKTILADDIVAVVGTANFDFRSFYLHFENGVLMYKTKAVSELKNDCLYTLENSCIEITMEDYMNSPSWKRFLGFILKIISPIL